MITNTPEIYEKEIRKLQKEIETAMSLLREKDKTIIKLKEALKVLGDACQWVVDTDKDEFTIGCGSMECQEALEKADEILEGK